MATAGVWFSCKGLLENEHIMKMSTEQNENKHRMCMILKSPLWDSETNIVMQ